MKVKEFIEKLQTLDPERNIWVFYDYPFAAFAPSEIQEADLEASKVFKKEGVHPADYFIEAG